MCQGHKGEEDEDEGEKCAVFTDNSEEMNIQANDLIEGGVSEWVNCPRLTLEHLGVQLTRPACGLLIIYDHKKIKYRELVCTSLTCTLVSATLTRFICHVLTVKMASLCKPVLTLLVE